jgi:chromosome segregation ATPase
LAEKAEKIGTLEAEIAEVIQSRGTRVASAIAGANEQIKILSNQLREAEKAEVRDQKELSAANENILKNESKLKILQNENAELVERNSQSNKLTEKQKRQIKSNERRIELLEKILEIARGASENARKATIAAGSRVNDLENAVRDAKAARDASKSKASALELTLREIGKQLADADEKVGRLEKKVSKLDYEREQLMNANALLKQGLAALHTATTEQRGEKRRPKNVDDGGLAKRQRVE